jgi:hypothetical protein
MGTEEVPLPCRTLLLDAEAGAVNCHQHQTNVANAVDELALKNDLWFGARRWTMQRGETTTGNDMTRIILLTTSSASLAMQSRKSQTHFSHGLRVDGALRPTDSGASGALPRIHLQKIESLKQMLGLAILGAQAALPQHAPHFEDDLIPRTKEAAESAVLHGDRAYFFVRPVQNFPGCPKKHNRIHLLVLIVTCIIVTHVVIVIVGCVVDKVTHLLLSVLLAVVDDSGNRSSR